MKRSGREVMKGEMEGKWKIAGAAIAVILVISVLAAIVPMVSATDVTSNYVGKNEKGYVVNPGVVIIDVSPGATDTVRIGQEILFINDTIAGGSTEGDYTGCEVKIEGYPDTATEGISYSSETVRNMNVGGGPATDIDSGYRVGIYYDTKDWPSDKTGTCKVTFKNRNTGIEVSQNITIVPKGTLSLDLKVGTTSVSSIAVGSKFKIDTGSPPLGPNDEVNIIIIKPDNTQLKATATQNFTKINTSEMLKYATDAGAVNTTGWDLGTYKIKIKSRAEHARGLEIESVEKELRIIKGTIDISAEKTSVAEEEIVRLTVTGVANRHIKVEAYPSSPHVIFPVGIDDNPNAVETDHFTHTIDEDSTRTYAVKFNDTGSYTIKVTDLDAGLTDTVDISVTEKAVTFDVPSTVTIGRKFTIKGSVNTGEKVDIAVEDYVYPELNDIVVDENNEFSVDIDTSTTAITPFTVPGSVRLRAFINREKGVGEIDSTETDDGSVAILMVRGGLEAKLSSKTIAQGDSFTISGTAPGSKALNILIIAPKGQAGSRIDGTGTGIYDTTTSVSETDDTFSKKINVEENVDTGSYLIVVLSPGSDGQYNGLAAGTGVNNFMTNLSATYTLSGKTQEEILDMIQDATVNAAGSDDLIWIEYIKVEAPYVRLSPIESVPVGEPLVVNGTSNREEGFSIVVTVKGPVELPPQTVTLTNGTFSATFDTSNAVPGTYTVKADDLDGHTDITTVEILAAVPSPTPSPSPTVLPSPTPTPTPTPTPSPTASPTPTPTPSPTPTPTPTPGFEAIFAVAGLLAVTYFVLRRKK